MLVMWGGNPKMSLCWATPLDKLIWVVFRRGKLMKITMDALGSQGVPSGQKTSHKAYI